MILRGLKGLLLGLVFGTVVGAISLDIIDFINASPHIYQNVSVWNWFGGLLLLGVPSSITGAINLGFKLSKFKGIVIAAISGITIVLGGTLLILNSGQNVWFVQGIYKSEEIIMMSIAIIGMPLAALLMALISTPKDESKHPKVRLERNWGNKNSGIGTKRIGNFQNMIEEKNSCQFYI
jgi:hypothetical protein